MVKNEVFTGEEITAKWPELVEWISQCHMLRFEIEFDIVETPSETGEVMEYHDSGIRRVMIEFREFSDDTRRVKDNSLPFITKGEE